MFVTNKKNPNKTLYTKRDTGFSVHIAFELERNYIMLLITGNCEINCVS